MISLRPYQNEAIASILNYWAGGGGNPLVDLATGTGKSLVIAKLTRDLLDQFPSLRVLMLVHQRELVEQNFRALLKAWPDAPVGIYSAGLGKRDAHHRITFASIQSVFRKAKALGRRDLILIDEAHLVPTAGNGMYRSLLDGLRDATPDLRVAGFTATPYRLDTGRLDAGGDRLFDETVYSYGIGAGIKDGFLSPLVSKAGHAEVDVTNVARRGGEFVPGALENAADAITAAAVKELVAFGQNRRSWLAFCAGVRNAERTRDEIRSYGITCEMVSGETPLGERDSIIRRFKAGEIRALTNAQVLTTGFDAPGVDLIAMLRPTLSTSLFVQICGRGTRLAPGKTDCLVLDFAGNVRRHGPVDAVSVGPRKGAAGGDDDGKVEVGSVRAKECPGCQSMAPLNASSCIVCGHEWPVTEKPRHEAVAEAEVGILSTEAVAPTMIPVVDWRMDRFMKSGSPDSIRVTYFAGLGTYTELLAFEWTGKWRNHACQWWVNHQGAAPFPATVAEAIDRWADGELVMPATISVKPRPGTKYTDIVARSFAPVAKGRAA
ncbi:MULTISPECIES: DEAD/DEAH box helicase [unclassified Mesorhizobium]|uniref:DEAD/DEAH box helicase n=1 Tax=unclassified Mesorhizobium TaxID=325217 RepID=UPI00112788D6|nr:MULTISPECIES: DEAD/DEAH box helicase [unclassified Mesorhizobium]TPK59054.1 DEAD/DEAH box helicase [Mesorhizobium sp. B2-5-1]TPL06665.1 DEAD/DEAH box helicase [Mesorhizobium sp. B2-4-11]